MSQLILTPELQHARPVPDRREMERAYLASDASYDGVFYVAVRSTGIFCLPSCRARKPLVKNVEFFSDAKSALFGGYRPCLRCRPMDSSGPEWVSKLVAMVEDRPDTRITEQDLRDMGLEPARVRRHFERFFGLSFQAYCRARRLAKGFEVIRQGGSVDDAVYESGYESHSGFREEFHKLFGVPPAKAASADCIQVAWVETPIGPMIAGATDRGLCMLEFTDRRMFESEIQMLRTRLRAAVVPGESEHHEQIRDELQEYFDARRTEFTVPLVRTGTPFEERVWDELLRILHGETRSYEDIAREVGSPKAVRAVGRANGMNRIAVVIPCHRVLNKNGDLCGYGGGLWRKRLLLHLESSRQPLS
jgi:AraC family transcriptional regulator, regulatory protein of adaptative response / methylated-DNA-[protein]-cysteine methyltransferase